MCDGYSENCKHDEHQELTMRVFEDMWSEYKEMAGRYSNRICPHEFAMNMFIFSARLARDFTPIMEECQELINKSVNAGLEWSRMEREEDDEQV